MYKIALLFAILASAQAQLISSGSCNFTNIEQLVEQNEQHEQQNFTIAENLLEIKRINNTWNTGHCTSLKVEAINGTDKVSVILKEVLDKKLIERNTTISPPTDEVGSINVVFSDDFNSNFTYLGIGDKYAVLYACSNVGEQKAEYAWVVSVNTTLTDSDKNITDIIIKNNNLENATWIETSHTAESCKSGGIRNIHLSPIFVLLFGFLVSKGL